LKREAVKKEKDEASQNAPLIGGSKLQREYADLEEIWKAEKGTAPRRQHLKRDGASACRDRAPATRGKLEQVAELQYGKLPARI
jgi:ATP-dependent Clp protease ATP-binding subunit ClpB